MTLFSAPLHSDTHDQDVTLSAASLLTYAKHTQVILQILGEDQGNKTKASKQTNKQKTKGRKKEHAQKREEITNKIKHHSTDCNAFYCEIVCQFLLSWSTKYYYSNNLSNLIRRSQSAYQNVLCSWELHVRTNQALLSLSLYHTYFK